MPKLPWWVWAGIGYLWTRRSSHALVNDAGQVTAYVPGITNAGDGTVQILPGESLDSYVSRGEASGLPYMMP